MPHLPAEPFTLNDTTILVFTRNGLGDAPAELQQKLAVKFLRITLDANTLPAKILFYTDGVKLRTPVSLRAKFSYSSPSLVSWQVCHLPCG